MSRNEYLLAGKDCSLNIVKSEKQTLIDEVKKQSEECRALAMKYFLEMDSYERRAVAAAIAQDAKEGDDFRKKAYEIRREMEIADSKAKIMKACEEALSGTKLFPALETEAATERTKTNNYTAAKEWSVSRFWSAVGTPPITGTALLLERVKRFISPEYAAIFLAERTALNKVNPLEAVLLPSMLKDKSLTRPGTTSVYHDLDASATTRRASF